MRFYEKWKQFEYYAIIGVVSLIALLFLPMLGSEAGLAWKLPTTSVGWIVYVLSKAIVATINILIFHCFIQQAKINSLDNEKYKKACEILGELKHNEDYVPRDPKIYMRSLYSKKGLSIFVTSMLSAVGLTQAVLNFDWISMLTYLFTIIMGLIFGILTMSNVEEYWCVEFYQYAIKKQREERIENNAENW